ncbi:hypothetical protein ABEW34_01920 [Paenibacillus algorifonticola]|uniref:hypothetical protein n=1 Tax=Paenibacillus algorifonticola TaxID=684063 RepID=UPI003D28D0C7
MFLSVSILIVYGILELIFTIHRYQLINRPLSKPTDSSPVRAHNAVFRRQLAYERLPEAEFKIISLALRSLSTTSIVEKVVDVYSKLVITTFFGVLAILMSDNTDMLPQFTNLSPSIYEAVAILAGCVALHFFFLDWKNSMTHAHLVVIDEIEKRSQHQPQP